MLQGVLRGARRSMWTAGWWAGRPSYRQLCSAWAVGKAVRSDPAKATKEAIEEVQDELLGEKRDICVMQMGTQHAGKAQGFASRSMTVIGASTLLGHVTDRGGGPEAAGVSGMSVAAVALPAGTSASAFHIGTTRMPDAIAEPKDGNEDKGGVALLMGGQKGQLEHFLLLLRETHRWPKWEIIGGESVPDADGTAMNVGELLVNGKSFQNGIAGVAVRNARLRTLVSHGCVPASDIMDIKKASGIIVEQLSNEEGDKTSKEVVKRVYQEMTRLGGVKDGAGVVLGVYVGPEETKESVDDLSNYTFHRLVRVDEDTGEFTVDVPEWRTGDFTGKRVRFFVQTDDIAIEQFRSQLSERGYDSFPQEGLFHVTSLPRGTCVKEVEALRSLLGSSVPLVTMEMRNVTVPAGLLPFSSSVSSVLAWWE